VSPEQLVSTPLTGVNNLDTAVLSADRDDPLAVVDVVSTVVKWATELTLVLGWESFSAARLGTAVGNQLGDMLGTAWRAVNPLNSARVALRAGDDELGPTLGTSEAAEPLPSLVDVAVRVRADLARRS
jgi:hypothetical protein